ncbi:MAG: hypothetical protein NTY25_10250, partial [Planctomycetia bacterium]|nr:hypothetical protein [Planctomycetia bacterium]
MAAVEKVVAAAEKVAVVVEKVAVVVEKVAVVVEKVAVVVEKVAVVVEKVAVVVVEMLLQGLLVPAVPRARATIPRYGLHVIRTRSLSIGSVQQCPIVGR